MKTILVIDSDVRRRELYGRILSQRGYEVVEAADAQQAHRIIEERDIDLWIVDHEIDNEDGAAFLASTMEEAKEARLVFVSAYFRPETNLYERLTEELGVDLVLHKPIAPLEFGLQIDSLLDSPEPTGLADDSSVIRQVGQMRSAFVDELEDEIEHLSNVVAAARGAQMDRAKLDALRAAARRIQSVASRHGYFDIGQPIATLEQTLEEIADEPSVGPDRWRVIESALRNARAVLLRLQSQPPSQPDASRQESPAPRTSTVLVIDDDTRFLEKAKRLGEQLLVEVCGAKTRHQALDLLDENATGIEAIFVNIDMDASFDPFHLVAEIRQRAGPHHMPIAFVSGRGRLTDRVQAAHAGAALFLDKPIDTTEFSQAVHHLVSQRRAAQPTVLVVDDDHAFAERARSLFESEQIVVAHLADSTRVLRHLERTNPDALVINALMPGVSGFDLCRMLRTIPRWQDLPVLFVSDSVSTSTRVAAYRCGADDIVAKSCAAEELIVRLQVRIERARLMRQRADRDLLTGLLTRRAFLESLAARISEVRRQQKPLALCLLDLDHFKQINDTHGHIAGDRVLAGLGRLLQNRFRFEDLRGRWGGEEFAIAIVGEDGATAQKVLERVQSEFETVDFEGADDESFRVTFSAGISHFPEDGTETDQLLEAADRRLYAAKERGRDLIVFED
ncbi:MAG: response regulator [Persicimonas sp.]